MAVEDTDGVVSGFISYSRGLEIVVGDEDDDVEALYTVRVEYLYVSPEARGQNLSTALMAVVMSDVLDDVDHLSNKIASSKGKLPDFSFRSRLTAEAHSLGGERFLDALHYNMADSMSMGFDFDEDPDESVERDYSY